MNFVALMKFYFDEDTKLKNLIVKESLLKIEEQETKKKRNIYNE